VSDITWELYAQGLQFVVLAQSDVQDRSSNFVAGIIMGEDDQGNVRIFILGDEIGEFLMNRAYHLAGYPHMGAHADCIFLTADAAIEIFGTNLCTSSEYTSLLAKYAQRLVNVKTCSSILLRKEVDPQRLQITIRCFTPLCTAMTSHEKSSKTQCSCDHPVVFGAVGGY